MRLLLIALGLVLCIGAQTKINTTQIRKSVEKPIGISWFLKFPDGVQYFKPPNVGIQQWEIVKKPTFTTKIPVVKVP